MPSPTIRHVNCHILVATSARCPTCTRYSSTLRVLLWRQSNSRCGTNTHMNDKWRTRTELRIKFANLKEKKAACKQLKRLEAKVMELTSKEGVEVSCNSSIKGRDRGSKLNPSSLYRSMIKPMRIWFQSWKKTMD